MSAEVTLVFPAFNSAGVLGAALAAAPPDAPIVVVDNASRDATVAVAQAARPDVRIVRRPINLGFSHACNAGLRCATTPFAAVVNPDLFLDPGAVAACLAAARLRPDAALFGLGDGASGTAPVDTPLLSGSFLMMRCAAVAPLGYFDEAFFLYFEDTDLCVRVAAQGFGVVTVPAASARHLGDASTASDAASDADSALEKAWLWGGSCEVFARKHAAHPEGRRAARKLRRYRLHAVLKRATLRWDEARVLEARLRGAAAVRAHGPEALFDNAFTRT